MEREVGAFLGVFLVVILFIGVIALAISIACIIGQWKVFEKAGKPGWAAIIPIYNVWVLFEIAGVNPLFCLFAVGGSVLTSIGNTFNTLGQRGNDVFLLIGILFNLVSIGLSITGMVFQIIASLNLAKCFNKSSGYGVGLALLGFVFYPMLGFDKTAVYHPIQK